MSNNSDVLVLNRFYQRVNVIQWSRALSMLYVGIARALDREYRLFDFESWSEISDTYGYDTIGLVDQRICIPRILVLQAYARIPIGRIRFSRQNIFLRDKNTCQYCG